MTAVLLVVGLVLVVLIMRRVRRGWPRWKGKDRKRDTLQTT